MALIQDICYEAVLKYGSRTAFDSLNNQTTFDRLWERFAHLSLSKVQPRFTRSGIYLYNEVSYERRRWPRASSQIEKETYEH